MAEWQLLNGADALAKRACERISDMARRSIAERGGFSLVLAGGSSPRRTYEYLCSTPQEWQHWSLYYGDERCLPAHHPQRNSRMVEDTGLAGRVGRHCPIPAELGPEAAAAEYARTIEGALPFDMVLLGMGEDGHTASLFPGRDFPDRMVMPVHDAPKPPPGRVSLTPKALCSCREMLALVAGAGKREAVLKWRAGVDLPIAAVTELPQATILAEQGLLELAG